MSADWYASRKGWKLCKANLMVEGNLDVRYFLTANDLYRAKHQKSLVGLDFSIFSAGSGDAGGTYGILDEFPTLFKLVGLDLDGNGRRKYSVGVLLDNDRNGQRAASALPKQNRSLHLWSQIFLLHRILPCRTRDSLPLGKHVESENGKYQGLQCEIEDLLAEYFIDLFMSENPRHKSVKLKVDDGFHVSWSDDAKHGLANFAGQYGSVEDFSKIIETLKSIRFYFGLPPDGVSH